VKVIPQHHDRQSFIGHLLNDVALSRSRAKNGAANSFASKELAIRFAARFVAADVDDVEIKLASTHRIDHAVDAGRIVR
jgi:hypothetical protein